MVSTVMLRMVIVLFSGIGFYSDNVKGRKQTREYFEDIDKQLKLLNKPYLKTIKTEYGDVYDCVDFYKQPAFDHPLLKNHNFHPMMRPSFSPKRYVPRFGAGYESEASSPRFRLDCPKGTVPIRRVTKDDLIRIKPLMKKFTSRTFTPNGVQAKDGTHFAIVQSTSASQPNKFKGVEGVLSIYNPSVDSSQYSSGEVIIQNGGDTITAGWTVNPALYNDNRTRGFIFTNAGNSTCFNTHCSGFVSTSSDIPVDQLYEISKRGENPIVDDIFIHQDKDDGNWWLEVGKDHGVQLGFWPKDIFSTLRDSASYVACGGEVNSPDGKKPPMGSTFQPLKDTNYDAFCANFGVVDDAQKVVVPTSLEIYVDDGSYKVANQSTDNLGYLILYGGPKIGA